MKIKQTLAATAVATGLAVVGFAAPAEASATFQTETNLNMRECPAVSSTCRVIVVIPKGASVMLDCWYPGTPVNGDYIWYYGHYGSYSGMVAGDYMNTGHDPNPIFPECG